MEVADGPHLQVMPLGWTIGRPTTAALIVAALTTVLEPTWLVHTYASTTAQTNACTLFLYAGVAITEQMRLMCWQTVSFLSPVICSLHFDCSMMQHAPR